MKWHYEQSVVCRLYNVKHVEEPPISWNQILIRFIYMVAYTWQYKGFNFIVVVNIWILQLKFCSDEEIFGCNNPTFNLT